MRFNRTNVLLRVFLLISVIFVSCNSNLTEKVIDTHEDGSPKTIKYFSQNNESEVLVKEVQFYKNGKKRYQGFFKDNKKDGKWTFWFEDGKPWSKGHFENGLRTGLAEVYHENGNLYYKGAYLEGKKHGIWKFYNDKGKVINVVTFEMGKFIKQTAKENPHVEKRNK